MKAVIDTAKVAAFVVGGSMLWACMYVHSSTCPHNERMEQHVE